VQAGTAEIGVDRRRNDLDHLDGVPASWWRNETVNECIAALVAA
jgi:hypothetical protein